MKIFDLLLRPVITEKATDSEKEGKYQFYVRKDATKIDIKEAFEKLYGVVVLKVNAMRTPSKSRLSKVRRPSVKRAELKKVIITTKGKKTLDVMKPKMKV